MNRPRLFRLLLLGLTLTVSQTCWPHESRPALLSLTESSPNTYSVLWKVPTKGNQRLGLSAVFPDSCAQTAIAPLLIMDGAALEQYQLQCKNNGLSGKTITIAGLSATITDVLLRIESSNGQLMSTVIRPESPSFTVPTNPTKATVIHAYGILGFEHILGGTNHLLFVLGLMLLVRNLRTLVYTITSFTLAHSLNLGSVSLGIIPQPGAAIEAVIALSILFLATEVIRQQHGEPSLTTKKPWLVAFIFGLLHGFGFAGALIEIGLPNGEIPLALLFFNIGIELGQLGFVVILLLGATLFQRLYRSPPQWAYAALPWGIGITASFWLFERTSVLIQ